MTDAAARPGDEGHGALKRSSVVGAAATFAGQGLRFVLQFASQIILARMLVPAEFGLVAMIGPVLGLVAVFADLGLTQATIQRPHISQAELSALFWINAGIGVAGAALMAAAAPLVAWFYGEPRLVPLVVSLASLLIVGGLSAQQVALMNRRLQFVALAAMDVACTALSVAAGIAAAWWGLGYWSLVVMQAVNAVTILAVAWACSGWMPSLPRRTPGAAGLLRFGGHMTVYNLLIFFGANMDSILIGRLAGSVPLGLYDRSYKLVAAPIWTISLPVARVAVAVLSRLHGAPAQYRSAFLQMLQVLLLATVPAVAFTAAASGLLVPLLLGPAWQAASPIVAWLAIATGFAPLSIGAYWLFLSQGRTGEQMAYAGARTVVSLLALLAGLPWGATGVAAAYAMAAIVVHGLPLWGAARRGPVGLGDILRACLPLLLAGIAAAAAIPLAEARLGAAGVPPLLRLGLEAVLAYAVSGVALLCLPGGARLLRDMWKLRTMFRGRALPAAAVP